MDKTKLTEEQLKKAKEQFEQDIKDVDQDDVEYATKKGNTKFNKFKDVPPNSLKQLWEDIKLMLSLLNDYRKGDYKDIPWNIIAAITGAIIYFISPIDVIPDFIPVVGYMDDALVIKLALDFASEDLNKYSLWKTERENI
jgi:uncharacterized membrane protein YkvA (DUF1232 family)